MAQAALEHCRKDKYRVAVAVVDRSSQPLAVLRESNSAPHLADTAVRKAYTARVFRRSSRDFSQGLKDNPVAAGLGTLPGVIASAGGIPVKLGDEVVGV